MPLGERIDGLGHVLERQIETDPRDQLERRYGVGAGPAGAAEQFEHRFDLIEGDKGGMAFARQREQFHHRTG